MSERVVKVRYQDKYGNVLAVVKVSVGLDELNELPQRIKALGDSAFKDVWARASVQGGISLMIQNDLF